LTQPHTALLLTTRGRIAFALGLTTLVFVQDIRGLHRNHTEPGWFIGAPLLHGWPLVAVNVFIYGYICWLGFWFIRGTVGRERFFMAGWFAGVVLWPIKMLRPGWALAVRYVGAFGLAVALLAAVALLLSPPDAADRDSPS
jgi:hypothetical protein